MTDEQPTDDNRRPSALDKRRDKAQAASASAEAARRRVDELAERIAGTATQAQQHETALRQALDEVSRHKKALKAFAKQQDRLRAARRKAETAAAKAGRKRQAAEERYDRAVLADLVRREKRRDLAAHGDRRTPQASEAAAPPPAEAPDDQAADQATDEATGHQHTDEQHTDDRG